MEALLVEEDGAKAGRESVNRTVFPLVVGKLLVAFTENGGHRGGCGFKRDQTVILPHHPRVDDCRVDVISYPKSDSVVVSVSKGRGQQQRPLHKFSIHSSEYAEVDQILDRELWSLAGFEAVRSPNFLRNLRQHQNSKGYLDRGK